MDVDFEDERHDFLFGGDHAVDLLFFVELEEVDGFETLVDMSLNPISDKFTGWGLLSKPESRAADHQKEKRTSGRPSFWFPNIRLGFSKWRLEFFD